jgi:hypothetical protein
MVALDADDGVTRMSWLDKLDIPWWVQALGGFGMGVLLIAPFFLIKMDRQLDNIEKNIAEMRQSLKEIARRLSTLQ